MVALTAVFLGGLMVGRKPEYLGKEIGVPEIKLLIVYTLAAPFIILLLTGLAVSTEWGLAGLTTNDGFHGFTEIFLRTRPRLQITAKILRDFPPTAFFII